MKKNYQNKRFIFVKTLLLIFFCFLPSFCLAMPPGALVYRTSSDGKMYGYSGDPLIYSEKGIVKNIYSGHVGIYIGQENGVDYVVEALSGGIVKTPADKFVNLAEGEKYLGAKLPRNLSAIQQAKVVSIAKSLVGKNLAYDFDFKTQKGPESGEWTCVGLTEKLYESANISNPNNLSALEYDENYYALDITPDGFDNYSVVNEDGDCFSREREFSKIARRTDLLVPAPEIIGFDVGLENKGERYIFIPYTQFLQDTLIDVPTDISLSSSFSGVEVRGPVHTLSLVLRWSLINNPLSSLKIIAQKTKDLAIEIKDKIFGTNNQSETEIVFNGEQNGSSSEESPIRPSVVVNKVLASKNIKTSANSDNKDVTKKVASSKKINLAEPEIKAPIVNKAQSILNKFLSASSTKKIIEKLATTTPKLMTTPTSTVKTTIAKKTSASSTNLTYYNPITKKTSTPSPSSSGSSGSGGGSSASNSQANDNFLKLASINKIYSTGDNDWVELYNPTDHDFDLAVAEYRLEKAKAAEDPTLIIRIGNSDDGSYPGGTVIKAHSYYLIVKSTANSYYLSQADAIAKREDFSWPNSAYTLFLGTGAISSNTDQDIVEAIGFGSDATYFQGTGPAPEIIDNYILNRLKNEGNNQLDFNLIKSDDPGIDWEKLALENSSTTDETIINEETATSSDASTSTSSPLVDTNNLALINKIYSTGDNDWIELYNPTDHDFDFASSSYRLEKAKTSEDPSILMRIGNLGDGSYPGGTTIKSKSNYLIVRDEANDYYKNKADAIATKTDFSWANSGYTLYLANDSVSSSTDSNIIDLVGFGSDASYWQGAGPAPEIIDNYILTRIATSGQNNLDFNLIAADDPNIDWSLNNNADATQEIYNFSASAANLFPFPEPISSEGLEYLWHFNECAGTQTMSPLNSSFLSFSDYWLPGKFDCTTEFGYDKVNINKILDQSLDINNFTVSFWFKATNVFPRLIFTLSNSDGDSINITLEPELVQFSGLPNISWRNYVPFAFDGTWRQATLVINRNEGYWALYIDGEERFFVNSYKLFAPMDNLIIGGDNGPFAIDELAIWSRALSPEEIISIRNADSPYNPIIFPESQKLAVLKHFWNFNEGIGTTSFDLVGEADLKIEKKFWNNIDLENSVINLSLDEKIKVNFPALDSPDLSLTFRWRSDVNQLDNRTKLSLFNEANSSILSVVPSKYIPGYYFNGAYGYFSYGEGLSLPLDSNWHDLALVYDSYRYALSLYVDGQEKNRRNFIWPANRPLVDGLEVYGENGSAEIDDLGVWEGALSPGQVQEIFIQNN